MQHMQQNDEKMLPKSTRRFPKSSPRRPRCSQDDHMGAKTPPKTVQKHRKKVIFLYFLQVFGAKCSQVPPRTPETAKFGAKRAPKTSPDPLWTLILLQFSTILMTFWKNFRHALLSFFPLLCFALLCFALLFICFAVLPSALLPFALLCFALLCSASLCFALLCFALPFFVHHSIHHTIETMPQPNNHAIKTKTQSTKHTIKTMLPQENRTIKTMPQHANHIFETMFLCRHGGGWCEAPGIWKNPTFFNFCPFLTMPPRQHSNSSRFI